MLAAIHNLAIALAVLAAAMLTTALAGYGLQETEAAQSFLSIALLTGFVAGLSRETVARNVTINGLLPGPFNTDRLKQTMTKRGQSGEDFEATMKREAQGNPARRFGEPDEFGAACAFLCSVHAGYITGQNLLMDGGSFRGIL